MLPYTTSVHLKRNIAAADGTQEKADWDRLLGMFGKAGYKGYLGLEYEGNTADADVPGLVADLRAVVRKFST